MGLFAGGGKRSMEFIDNNRHLLQKQNQMDLEKET